MRDCARQSVLEVIAHAAQSAVDNQSFMSESPENLPDMPLRLALQEAHPTPALPPRFQASVWQRIEQQGARVAPRQDWLSRLAGLVIRPQFITTGLALVMLAGVLLGIAQSGKPVEEVSRARYLAKVDPWQGHP